MKQKEQQEEILQAKYKSSQKSFKPKILSFGPRALVDFRDNQTTTCESKNVSQFPKVDNQKPDMKKTDDEQEFTFDKRPKQGKKKNEDDSVSSDSDDDNVIKIKNNNPNNIIL